MAKTRDRFTGAANNARPYVERAFTDQELRENVKAAFTAARDVYEELLGNRGVTHVATRVATDKEIQDKLREAVDELRVAADRVQGKQKQHSGRNTLLLLVGIALGILFNPVTGPATRKWIADAAFGGDDFTYEGPADNGTGSAATEPDSAAA
jgi:hypothetical protein